MIGFYLVAHFIPQSAGIVPQKHALYPQQDCDTSTLRSFSEDERTCSKVAAVAVSKVVFKNGRKTIAPAVMLELAGLLAADGIAPIHRISDEASEGEVASDPTSVLSSHRPKDCPGTGIELERQCGLQSVHSQHNLDLEIRDKIALGRHFDGHGIEGVLATLAQLGRLSSFQFL